MAGVARAPDDGWSPGPEAVVVFLTSSCRACRCWWAELAAEEATGGVVVVTPDPSLESRRAVARLAAPLAVPVVMSSATWLAHGVRGAPWALALRGGRQTAAGTAASWAELRPTVVGRVD